MKTTYGKYLYMLLPLLFLNFAIKAQTNLQLSSAVFSVAGTSSLHDWTMDSKSGTGEAVVETEGKTLEGISKLTVRLKAETLKSGKSGMDDNAYKALKTKKNPDITFALQQIKSIEKQGDYYVVKALGTLTIAGESKTIPVEAKAYPTGNAIEFKGSNTFKMTDFKVDPPTALMGTIKTGDEITINYNLTFKSK